MNGSSTPRVIVFGWGNVTRGDDGLGPQMMERLERLALPHVTAIEDFQLQIDHALDIAGHDLVLFIDAGENTPAPFSFTEIQPSDGVAHTSHALRPEAVLAVYRKVTGKPPPPAFVLCLRGELFDLVEQLSEQAASRLDLGWIFLQERLHHPSAEAWRSLITGHKG